MPDSIFSEQSRDARLLSASGVELARLRLTPEEGFVLSRIDRSCTVAEILATSGLGEARTLSLLKALHSKGAIRFEGESPARPTPRVPPLGSGKYGSYIFSPAELNEEQVELEVDRRKEILYVHAQLTKLTHYELLGVRVLADKGDIKRGYFEQSKKFHPDRFYGKKLGAYKAKLAEIFQHLTNAYEVLSHDARREEYDRSGDVVLSADELAEVAQRGLDKKEDERRVDERRKRLMHAKGFARLTRARELATQAEKVLEEGNSGLAAQLLQDAVELDPKHEPAKARLAEVKRTLGARRALAEIADGERREAAGDLASALERYRAAVTIDPASAQAHDRLARALMASGHDIKEVKMHAQRATELDPKMLDSHLTLAQVYLKMGLKKNARREFEAALEIDPENGLATSNLKRL